MRVFLILLAAAAAIVPARTEPIRPPWYVKPMALDTGLVANPSEGDSFAVDEVIGEPDAPWIQIRLSDWKLGENSRLIITSLEDGDVQYHSAATLQDWGGRSAIFRGGLVRVQLLLGPGEEGAFIRLRDPVVGLWVGGAQNATESLCGSDDRVASSESRVGRLYFGGCTVFYAPNGSVLTAGHCVDFDPDGGGSALPDGVIDLSNSDIVEINPPASRADGTPVPAAVNNQYPVRIAGAQFHFDGEGQGLGKDFAVFGVAPNSNTGLTPHVAGGFYRFSNDDVTAGTTIRITGYGADTGTANKTNQTSTGPFQGQWWSGSNTYHGYKVDTAGASSGSPIYNTAKGAVIGVHTNGGCNSDGSGMNYGTAFDYSLLQTALQNWLGTNTKYADSGHPDTGNVGTIYDPFTTVAMAVAAAPSGGVVAIVEGSYTKATGNVFTIGPGNKALTLVAPVGTVVIGN